VPFIPIIPYETRDTKIMPKEMMMLKSSSQTGSTRSMRQARVLMAAILVVTLLAPLQGGAVLAQASSSSHHGTTMTVFATGFDNPRGLKFGPDGFLYVAEGGKGGTDSTEGQCEQVIPPVGPYTGGMTARISKVNQNGERSTVIDGLPSSQTSEALGSLVSGVADVAFMKGQLYALLAGAGCSHGISDVPNGIIRVNSDGTWTLIADLSAFQKANPVAQPEEDDFEPDGTWYSMVVVGNSFYAVEPNHGELDRVTLKGAIQRVVDISESQGHIVPTTIDFHRGHFFVGNLSTFPIVDGAAKVLEISRKGKVSDFLTGFTNVVAAVFGKDGALYVLESTIGNPMPVPGAGVVVRVDKHGERETIATGLSVPTAMTFGPDGALYVSNFGYGAPPGVGEIVKIELGD
jgi:hypothetical protein